jgi:putative sterol carrier protein
VIRYLSLKWIDALAKEVAGNDAVRRAAGDQSIGVTQVVTEGPEGDVIYHLQVVDGEPAFGAGPAWPEDVKMQQTWGTAVAVATGELNAQEAFLTGRILLTGDQQKLVAAQPIFGALDAVFDTVRARTAYR